MKPQTSINSVLTRAATVFPLIFALLTATAATAVYAGLKSGEIQEKIVEPIQAAKQNAIDAINKIMEDTPASTLQPVSTDESSVTSESKSTVIINNDTPSGNSKRYNEPVVIQWVYPTLVPGKSYEETQKEMDEWWAKVQAENQQRSAQSQQQLEQFRQQSQLDMEKFKEQGNSGMEDFRKKMEQQQKDFLLQHGITP